jgi:hypothetical protein
VQNLSEQTLAAIGRMTVAATDLEYLLAWTGADQAAGDTAAVFAEPGRALAAARASVQFAAVADREQLIAAVEAAATQLALSQVALRRLWHDDSPADAAVLDRITAQLVTFRAWLHGLVAEQIDR